MSIVLRRSLQVVLAVTLAVLLVAGGALAWLQTASGKTWLAASLSRALSSADTTVTLSSIDGAIPFGLRVGEIRLADRDGIWLTATDAIVDIAARDLLRGRLTVRQLGAEAIELARLPVAAPQEDTEPAPAGFPDLPLAIELRRLSVPRIHLAAPVLGEPVTASLDASGLLIGSRAAAQLAIERRDDAAGHVRLELDAHGADVSLHVDVGEPSGMLLRRMLSRDEAVPLAITIEGSGPLEAWRGTLSARAGELAHVEAAFTITGGDGYRIASDGTASVAALLPPGLAPLVPAPMRFATVAAVKNDTISVEALDLSSGAITLAAGGRLAQATGALAGEATVTVADLAALDAIAGMPLAGAATVAVKASGTLDQPRANIVVSAHNLKGGRFAAADATAATEIALTNGIWRLTGAGAIDALALPFDRPGLPKRVDWDFAALADERATRLTVERLAGRSDEAVVTAAGTADALDRSPRIDGTARIEFADLSRFAELAALPLVGRVAVDIHADASIDAITATIDARADGLGGVQPAIDALLGSQVRLQGSVSRAADGEIVVQGVRLQGAHVSATAEGKASGDLAQIAGKATLDLPLLAVLEQPLGMAIDGSANARAAIGGSLAHPAIDARAEASRLRVNAQRLDQVAIDLALNDAMAPEGTLLATFKGGALDGRAEATFARTVPDRIAVSKLRIAAPGTAIDGALDLLLDKGLVSGTLNGRVADLSSWSPLAGTKLAGAVDARATLVAKDGQRADIDASVRDLRIDEAAVASARIEARLADLRGKPSGRAKVEADRIEISGLRADAIKLTAQSSRPGRFNVTADAHGALRPDAQPSAFRVFAAGEIVIDEREQGLRLTKLAGRLGDYDIASQAPLTVAAGADRLRVEGLDLRIGRGRLSGKATRIGERLSLQVDARDLPLGLVGIVAHQRPVDGALGASLSVSGTATRPEGKFEALVRGLRPAGAGKDMPPVAVAAQGTWKDARLDLSGRIDGPEGTGLDIAAALPLLLDARTLAPTVPSDGAMSATARGDGRLETWAGILPLGEDRLFGRYAVDLFVRGTIKEPQAGGRLTVSDARYLNFAAGTELRNLSLEFAGEGQRFALKHLAASDAANGSLAARGSVDLSASPGPALDFSADVANFQVMRRDDLSATADGELRLAGTPAAATLSGRVRVDRAEIRIPDKLPPSIARLDVIEIDSRRGETPVEPEKKPDDGVAVGLDLRLDIPARAFVRGRGLDSEWKGRAHVAGTTAKPVITGRLETVRGDLAFLGKRFVLADSTIDFNGGDTIDPLLNIVAEHKSAAIVAQAIISGPVSDPSIKLTSQPELPQDEVLSQVLFGKGAGEITPVQGLQLAQAAATLAGRGGPGILDRVRAATGLDRLDIQSGEPTASGASGTRVTAGEYVSDRVFVGVEQGATAESTRTKVEVEILPNVTVESSVGTNSSAGVGVNWKWDY